MRKAQIWTVLGSFRLGAVLTTASVLSAAVVITGCGQYLGDQRFERVRVVTSRPMDSVTGKDYVDPYGRYLEVEFSSELDLMPIATQGHALYVEADPCPMSNRDRLWVFGPFSGGREIASDPGVLVERLPRKAENRRVYDHIPGQARTLEPDPSDGRYRYTAYLLPSHPMPGVEYNQRMLDRPRYDLARQTGDVCLRLFSPGYNLIKSRSDTIVVPSAAIAAALAAGPQPRG